MDALRAAGFRDALGGEFTFRAFMNGKLDLSRCESVMELVSAKTDTGRRHAVARLSGVLENEINDIKKQLVEVLSGVEVFLDYSDDEVSADADEAEGVFSGQESAREILFHLRKLAQSWQREKIYQEGIFAVIAGRPNAGKSSLFNLLLKEERSIVTEIPGTTRDWIEAWVCMDGIPIRLADTAGLRDPADNQDSLDPVEKIGVERSHALLEEAELVLYVIDGTMGITAEDRAFINNFRQGIKNKTLLILWNKADISPCSQTETTGETLMPISAKTGDGIEELVSAIVNAIGARVNSDSVPVAVSLGTIRQKNLVDAAIAALESALTLAGQKEPLDIIAPALREAVNSLGEITGEVSTADILEEMFSRFCVGK
jgi:tRNA modification GTPase